MSKRVRPVLPWACLLPLWMVLVGVAHGAGHTLTMGSISNDPAKEIHRFLPVANHLAAQLAAQGIDKGQVVVAADMQEMAEHMKSGRVDLYLDSPLPSLLVNRLAGGKMVLRRWKQGQAEYKSVVFVKKESPIQTLAQLAGRVVSFKDAYSSSGYLMPRIAMEEAGLQLVDVTHKADKIPADKTGYLLANDRETSLFWVTMGKADAGAMSVEDLVKQAKGDQDKLRIIHQTESLPRHVVNLRGGLPEPLAKAVVDLLLGMEQQELGRQILTAFEQTTRFDPIPKETELRLQKMVPTVLKILGTPP